jgi:hypothetical protein
MPIKFPTQTIVQSENQIQYNDLIGVRYCKEHEAKSKDIPAEQLTSEVQRTNTKQSNKKVATKEQPKYIQDSNVNDKNHNHDHDKINFNPTINIGATNLTSKGLIGISEHENFQMEPDWPKSCRKKKITQKVKDDEKYFYTSEDHRKQEY